MANRSMLFAVSAAPAPDQPPERVLALGEFGWDIPTVFKLLVSVNPRPCTSIVWELDELVAIVGDAHESLSRLTQLRAGLDEDAAGLADIDAALEYLSKPHIEEFPFFLMEPGEILELTDTPFPEQMDALIAEISSLEIPALVERANATAPPEDWGPGCWSSILYYQPKGSVDPPIDPSETFIMTTAAHIVENATVWENCTAMSSVSVSEFDGRPGLLIDVLNCLKQIPNQFGLSLSGSLDQLPDEVCELTQLTRLTIGQMGLIGLPDGIGDLRHLETLNVQNNALTEFPESIRMLSGLKTLSVWNHPFGALPDWIGELSHLESLWIGSCGLSSLPDSLWSLSNLKELNISITPELTKLPPRIGELEALEILNVYACRLTTLPSELADLPNLREVWASKNNLRNLPKKLWRKPLDTLSVAGNGLKKPWRGAKAKQFWI